MKGTNYNGSYFANKGTSRSEGETMFSVGRVVAFSYRHFCSPDGRSSSRGTCPTTENYQIQEEILLEEYDNTASDSYGSGNYDRKKIVELLDVFWHEYSSGVVQKTFMLQILEHEKNIFAKNFIFGDIAEVRNHPGKFLHIYEIPEGYRKCQEKTFAQTANTINLQKKQEDDFETQKVAKRYRGVELIFGITSSGWYASRASFGHHSVQLAHEYDSTSRDHHKLVIMPCVPDGSYEFYLGGTPMSLYLRDGREPSIDTLTDTHWANSQSWRYCQIRTLSLKKGWILVNGEDVYESTKKTIDKLQAAHKAARKTKFEELSKAVTEKYGEEILKIALRKKGSVLAILKALSESTAQVELADLKKIFSLSSSTQVIANLMVCVAAQVEPFHAAKVAQKAHAWAYLKNTLPGVSFVGFFDEARTAIELFAENWQKVKNKSSNFTIGEYLDFKNIKLA